MKNIKSYASSIILLAITFALGAYLGDMAKELIRKQQGKRYVESSIKAMATRWDPIELDTRAHVILMQGLHKSNQSTAQYFRLLSALGALKSADCQLMTMAAVSFPIHYVSMGYSCKMFFDNSPGTFNVEIRQENLLDDWKIATLNVDAPIFSQDGSK